MITVLAVFAAVYLAIGVWLAPGSYRKFGARLAQDQGHPLFIRQKVLIAVLAVLIQPAALVAVLWGQLRK